MLSSYTKIEKRNLILGIAIGGILGIFCFLDLLYHDYTNDKMPGILLPVQAISLALSVSLTFASVCLVQTVQIVKPSHEFVKSWKYLFDGLVWSNSFVLVLLFFVHPEIYVNIKYCCTWGGFV